MTGTRTAPAMREGIQARVADGIYRLGDPYVNWYVIDNDGRLTIIDTGLPAHWPQLPALLGALRLTFADVKAVVLTHQHPDHLGVAERVREAANVPVFIHPADAAGARHSGRGEGSPSVLDLLKAMRRSATRRYLTASMRSGVMRVPAIASLDSLADGERLDVPGRPLVIHTPGHTRGQCALLLEDRNVLFSGDALVTYDPGTGRLGPSLLTRPFVLDPAEQLASLTRLEAVHATTVLPGHGEPWRDGVLEALRLARES